MKSQTYLGFAIEDHKELLTQALRTRLIEEKMLRFVKSGKVRGTFHSCLGQEAIGAGLSLFLKPEDVIFSHHRNHGHILPLLKDPSPFLAELLAKEGALCGGHGGTQHLHIKNRFFSSGVQGSLMPVAAGWAFEKCRNDSSIAVSIIGDGTLGRGVVYETLNLVSLKQIPILILVEDNGVAQSAESKDYLAGSIELRAKAFGLDYASTDTYNWLKLSETLKSSLEFVRKNKKPFFLRIETSRLGAHSRGDDFRPKEQVDSYWARDVIELLRINEHPILTEIENAENLRVEACLAEVLKRPAIGAAEKKIALEKIEFKDFESSFAGGFFVQKMNDAVKNLLQKNKKLKFVGEDILDPYGGAFKVPKGLSSLFSDQFIQTPISEETIAGFSHGLSLAGGSCLSEFMFADFSLLAVEAITTTGEVLRNISPDTKGPVFRLPTGGGSGYGPTHSQSPERTFLSYDNIQILSLTSLLNPELILESALKDHKCSIVIEPKMLYSLKLPIEIPAGFTLQKSNEKYPTLWLKPEGPEAEVTIVAYGCGGLRALEAVSEIISTKDIVPEVFILTKISQLENFVALDHFRNKTLLLIDDGPQNHGAMAYLASLFMQNQNKPKQITLLGAKSSLIPAATQLEDKTLVSVSDIVEQIGGPA